MTFINDLELRYTSFYLTNSLKNYKSVVKLKQQISRFVTYFVPSTNAARSTMMREYACKMRMRETMWQCQDTNYFSKDPKIKGCIFSEWFQLIEYAGACCLLLLWDKFVLQSTFSFKVNRFILFFTVNIYIGCRPLVRL